MLLIQRRASLFAGDDGPDNGKFENLDSIQLPELEEGNEAHMGAGSFLEVEYGNLGLKALKPTFKLKGWDNQVMSMMGARKRSPWTVYGVIRDMWSEDDIEVKAIIRARLGKISPEAFEGGKLMGHDHALHEVVQYQVYFDEKEKYYFDAKTQTYRVDGKPVNADERRILRLPGA